LVVLMRAPDTYASTAPVIPATPASATPAAIFWKSLFMRRSSADTEDAVSAVIS
jgi:hypothetical protein